MKIDPEQLSILASAATGLAVFALVWVLFLVLSVPRADQRTLNYYEYKRRLQLREGSFIYRWFEPVIDPLADWLARGKEKPMALFARSLALVRTPLSWKPEEFLAAKHVEGTLAGLAIIVVIFAVTESLSTSLVLGLGLGLAYAPLARKAIQSKADARLKTIRRRLPFVIDLIALTMEAGASFLESLQVAVRENAKHPLGEQFAEVLSNIASGRTPREALEALQQRLGDEDASEIIFAIIKSDELGTPLSQILRVQADQMRLKRSQWAEKAAAEAQVSIVFPGLVIMVACLLVVLAPFLMGAFYAQR